MMKCLIVAFTLFGVFAAVLPARADSPSSHKPHKVKRHKGVKHHG